MQWSYSHGFIHNYCPPLPPSQEEQYNHIEAAEMQKVREAVQGKREWLHSQMQTASRIPKHANPSITCAQIRAEKAVRRGILIVAG